MVGVEILAGGMRLGAPLALTAIGESFAEQAGVVNVQLEGMMLTGAFTGAVTGHYSGSTWIGLLGACGGGLLVALIQAVISITLGADQLVCGIALNLLALGATSFLLMTYLGGVRVDAPTLDPIKIPLLGSIPWLGRIFFNQDIGVYLALLLLVAAPFILKRTPWGLRVSAVGEDPFAADALGVNVVRTRYQATLLSGVTAGLAGGVFALGELGFFVDNMIQGRGFIALAAVILGNWRPATAGLAALAFGVADASRAQLLAYDLPIPPEVVDMLPYLITILVLAFLVRRSRAPANLALPYFRHDL